MKKHISFLTVILIAIMLYSCGPTIKVTKVWKAPDIQDVKMVNILVMARMDDLASRQIIESEIASQLKAVGVNAKPCFLAYPDLKLNKKVDESTTDEQISEFIKDGYGAVVLTVVKNVNENITVEQSSGYEAGEYGGVYFGTGSAYIGFSTYYSNFYSPYGLTGVYVPSSERTYQTNTYNLETVVYDLSREKDKQLVGVVDSSIKSPGSASAAAKPYAKKVVAQFEN